MNIQYFDVDKLIPYENNAKIHTKEQVQKIANSIKEFGFTQPLVIGKDKNIIIGHGRLEASKLLGMDKVPCLLVDDLTETQIKMLRIADNKLNESEWDDDLLKEEIEGLIDIGVDIDLEDLGIDFDTTLIDEEIETENPYTKKINIPTYEPNGQTPDFSEMYDTSKTMQLIKEIENSSIDKEIKDFLRMAAFRYTIFNYEKIADFYANADKEVQELMERLALVIIDFGKAIENGFVELSNNIIDSYLEDYPDE